MKKAINSQNSLLPIYSTTFLLFSMIVRLFLPIFISMVERVYHGVLLHISSQFCSP